MRKRKGTPVGRPKKGDENVLLSLFSGGIRMEDLKIFYKPIYTKLEIIDGKPVKTEVKEISHFGSGRDAYAYHILKGDPGMLRDLASKLYADKKYVEGSGLDGALKIQVVRYDPKNTDNKQKGQQ